jgi:hypothetical protein
MALPYSENLVCLTNIVIKLEVTWLMEQGCSTSKAYRSSGDSLKQIRRKDAAVIDKKGQGLWIIPDITS